VLLALGLWIDARLPVPLTEAAPAGSFSEARARRSVEALAGAFPQRASGTPGALAAAAWVESQVRAMPGLQVKVQDERSRNLVERWELAVSGSTRNILALLPGVSEETVLLSAHYDSPPTSPGAADDAAGVAVLLEIARALHAGPPLQRTVLFLFNGAEEPGLVGSAAFLELAQREQVRAFVNVEAAGAGGKAALFQVDGGMTALHAYARVPSPHGTVVAEELFAVLGANITDFDAYAPTAAVGVDQALYLDGYAYHTPLDTPARLEPGSLQHLGANTLALTRALAGDASLSAALASPVYFDLLGTAFIAYEAATQQALGGALLLAAAALLTVALRRLGTRQLLAAAGTLGVGLGGAALVTAAGATVLSLLNPHAWYASPTWGLVAFGALAAAGLLWRPRRREPGSPAAEVAVALAGWGLCAAVMLGLGLRSAYLPLAWCAALLMLLAIALQRPRWPEVARPLLALLPALLWVATGLRLHGFLVPLAGALPLDVPLDLAVALLVLLIVAAPLSILPLPASPRSRWVAPGLLAVGLVGICVLLASAPYTQERPKRLRVIHRTGPEGSRLQIDSLDPVSPGPALPEASAQGWSARGAGLVRRASEVSIPATEVTAAPAGAGDWREVILRFHPPPLPDGTSLPFSGQGVAELAVPPGAHAEWSTVGEPEPRPVPHGQVRLVLDHEGASWIALRLRGPPVSVTVSQSWELPTSELDALLSKLPVWVAPHPFMERLETLEL
jgi:hypothetical protein